MLKRNSKALAIVMAFVFCLSFLAPAFVAPDVAEAASTYTALSTPIITANSAAAQDLAIIQVNLSSCAAVKLGDVLTVSLPSDITLPATAETGATLNANAAQYAAAAGAYVADATAINTPAAAAATLAVFPAAVAGGVAATSNPALYASVTTYAAQILATAPATTVAAAAALVAAKVTAVQTEITAAAAAAVAGTTTEVVFPALNADASANGLVGTYTAGGYSSGSAVTTATRTAIDITFTATTGSANMGSILIYLRGAIIGSVEGDINASMLAPANSAFTMGSVLVGKATSSSGSTVSSISSVKTIGTTGGACDIISVTETAPNTLKAGEVIKVKLPSGFNWGAGAGTQSWGWVGTTPTVAVNAADPRILDVTVTGAFPSVVGGLSGRVNFAAAIVVDDSIAKTGDITARVYSLNGAATETDLVIAKYGTYGVTTTIGTAKDLIAGKYDQKIGNFFITEDLAGSLINGRQIKMTLPQGVKWSGSYSPLAATTLPLAPVATSGSVALGAYGIADNNTTLKTTVTTGTKSKFEFKDLKVDVSPDFVGPITLTISGDAGATGEVVVGNVTPAVEISAEEIKDVKIGEQNQELGTIILKETVKENIALTSAAIDTFDSNFTIGALAGTITLTLPGGAEWSAGFPTVEVTEGDLQLKTNSMTKAGAVLTIPVKSTSTKPSTIKVSDMKATLYRTVPEGPFEIAVAGTAINETGGVGYAFGQYEDNEAAVAKCITPAPGEGTDGSATGQFNISSNIYSVNGVTKVMDVAPYIKASRTYVPMRYVGEIIGAEVVWDDAARTVTLTKDDNVVVFTIGSTTYTVNGEAKVADVAPEITNDRTMLPARFVAEAFGYVVGWDPGTQTVLISK